MKHNTITPNIISLYLGQKCTYDSDVLTEPIETEINARVLSDMEDGFASITPHLRRLESMTEDEAREVYEIAHGEAWENWKEYIEMYSPEGSLLIGFPAVWLKLLGLGFDLFGLIDAGLAKEIVAQS